MLLLVVLLMLPAPAPAAPAPAAPLPAPPPPAATDADAALPSTAVARMDLATWGGELMRCVFTVELIPERALNRRITN